MTWLAIKLFLGGALKRLWGALSALLSLVCRYPLQAALIASLCLAGWQWWGKNAAIGERDLAYEELAAFKVAGKANAMALEKQRADAETRYAEIARNSDHEHTKDLAAARSAADRYIAANRLRKASGGVCAAPAAPQSEGAGLAQAAPPVPDAVAVSAGDVRACADNYTYARSAYDWARALITDGKAD